MLKTVTFAGLLLVAQAGPPAQQWPPGVPAPLPPPQILYQAQWPDPTAPNGGYIGWPPPPNRAGRWNVERLGSCWVCEQSFATLAEAQAYVTRYCMVGSGPWRVYGYLD